MSYNMSGSTYLHTTQLQTSKRCLNRRLVDPARAKPPTGTIDNIVSLFMSHDAVIINKSPKNVAEQLPLQAN